MWIVIIIILVLLILTQLTINEYGNEGRRQIEDLYREVNRLKKEVRRLGRWNENRSWNERNGKYGKGRN